MLLPWGESQSAGPGRPRAVTWAVCVLSGGGGEADFLGDEAKLTSG